MNSSMAAPTWDFDFSQTSDYQGFAQRDLNISLIVFSTLFVFARLYVRAFMTKSLGLDDLMTVAAYLILTVFAALEVRTVGLGSGAHIDEIPGYYVPPFFAALTTQNLMYFWCVGLMRLAIVAFLLRLAKDAHLIAVSKKLKMIIFVTGGIILAQTISCFLFRLLECKTMSHLWLPPGSPDCISKDSEAAMMWTHGAVGIAVDIALLALPVWVVSRKMMNTSKAIRVVFIFFIGIFVIITGIVRLSIMIRTDFAIDTTYKMATIAFWTDLEGHVGLWCACFPALQPLVRLVSFKCGLRSKLDSTNKYIGKPSAIGKSSKSGLPSVGDLESGFTSRSKNGYLRSSSGFDGTADDGSDANSRKGIINEAHAAGGMELDEFDDDLPRQGTIKRKMEIEIQVTANTQINKVEDMPTSRR